MFYSLGIWSDKTQNTKHKSDYEPVKRSIQLEPETLTLKSYLPSKEIATASAGLLDVPSVEAVDALLLFLKMRSFSR